MKAAIPRERRDGETRVAASPETVKKLGALGFEVTVEKDAGAGANISDEEFRLAGATVAKAARTVVKGADVVLKVRAPTAEELGGYKRGAVLVGMLAPHTDSDLLAAYAAAEVDAYSLELLPRITRAQNMDVLSSQANLAGYKAVIDAAAEFKRAMPMMMTAAGTVPAARVMVLGAGVAGLQAIATARRLGAIVCATDVRPAAKEQVESLGATFVSVESEETQRAETSGGYAREMSEDYRKAQADLIATTLEKQDIVICTALVLGRAAPVLVTEEMVKGMKAGSVIVDLAVERGGNCPLSRPDEVVEAHGVTVIGHANVPGRVPVDASLMYARNLLNFLTPLVDAGGGLVIDPEDEIISSTALTRAGKVVHPMFTEETDG